MENVVSLRTATVISFSNQKGGVGKSTTSTITAYLLSQEARVLFIDMDSQSDGSEILLPGSSIESQDKTVLEAMKDRNAKPYIQRVTDTLYLLPADDLLATFPAYVYQQVQPGDRAQVLQETIRSVASDFDYIIVDTPPALGDSLVNALAASHFVVVLFEPSQLSFDAMERLFEVVEDIQDDVNPRLKVAGILPALIDARRSDVKGLLKAVRNEYGDQVFDTVIKRKAATGRIPIEGIINNPEISAAVEPYRPFLDELLTRIKEVKV